MPLRSFSLSLMNILEPYVRSGNLAKINLQNNQSHHSFFNFSGILNQDKPYAFVRGCIVDIFAMSSRRPAEIDFLHRSEICVSIPLSQIWPDAFSDEIVHVCSCTTSGCNLHDAISSSPPHYPSQILFSIILGLVIKLLR